MKEKEKEREKKQTRHWGLASVVLVSDIEYHTKPLGERTSNLEHRTKSEKEKMDAENGEHRLIACITNKFSTASLPSLSSMCMSV